ncbi:hypothetical protein Pla163_11260 [Planctomycetes bacterium Pla163]|uniref:Uncharacterized protein n=1 Tax=Rohdeia mirabilis TaxID=2528008 RepID=A0A518CXS7_9BACT|nr:hypothetical protein Pla163_11260 [Planctomycetes bacterium Pla163]
MLALRTLIAVVAALTCCLASTGCKSIVSKDKLDGLEALAGLTTEAKARVPLISSPPTEDQKAAYDAAQKAVNDYVNDLSSRVDSLGASWCTWTQLDAKTLPKSVGAAVGDLLAKAPPQLEADPSLWIIIREFLIGEYFDAIEARKKQSIVMEELLDEFHWPTKLESAQKKWDWDEAEIKARLNDLATRLPRE